MASQDEWQELYKLARFAGYEDVWDFLASAPAELWSDQEEAYFDEYYGRNS